MGREGDVRADRLWTMSRTQVGEGIIWMRDLKALLEIAQIFIFTASRPEAREHYDKTINRPIEDEDIKKFLGEAFLADLRSKHKGHIYAWGATPGPRNIPLWEKMQIGDLVVSYQNRQLKELFQIIGKAHNERFAKYLWGIGRNPDNRGKTWEYMYFLRKIAKIDKPSSRRFQGHTGPLSGKCREDVVKVILAAILSRRARFIEQVLKRVKDRKYHVEDRWTKAKTRVAHRVWREIVLRMYGYKCAICGLDVPELLDAAHIVPWAKDPSKRLDPNNGIALCVLHHRAYDRGLIKIENGRVICTNKITNREPGALPEVVKLYLLAYHGKEVSLPERKPEEVIEEMLKQLKI